MAKEINLIKYRPRSRFYIIVYSISYDIVQYETRIIIILLYLKLI